jgi:GxxExxY protein
MHNEVWYKLECSQIQRAVVNVYQKLGRSLHETDYKEELRNEFSKLGIPYSDYSESDATSKNVQQPLHYQPHFICHGVIAVKIKVLPTTHHEHKTRIGNYLKASKNRMAILANFGAQPQATVERITR